MADLEDRVCGRVAQKVRDPVLGQTLQVLQWLHKKVSVSSTDGSLQILLRPPSLLHPLLDDLKEKIRSEAEQELRTWLNDRGKSSVSARVSVQVLPAAPVSMMARLMDEPDELVKSLGPGLANVTHFLAVYSCKGGVGKSTVAVNLAYELARMGGRVGLLDIDIYGPSLPLLIHPKDVTVRRSPKGTGMVYPIEHKGVKALSLGFVAKDSGVPGSGPNKNGAAIMRGPLAGKVVSQLLKGTDWGDLDVLVLDMPPGTGDVQIGVLQDLQLSGAVAVTTPSKLALSDTQKGIEMFTSMGVPTLSVVENMSYFKCEGGSIHYPFGKSIREQSLTDANSFLQPSDIVQLPLATRTNTANDEGEPLTLIRPTDATESLIAFKKLASNVSSEMLKLQFGSTNDDKTVIFFPNNPGRYALKSLHATFEKAKSDNTLIVRFMSDTGAIQKLVSAKSLRARDPKTGNLIEDSPFAEKPGAEVAQAVLDGPMVSTHTTKNKRSPSVIPMKVERKGRYGYSVEYADGGTIIYSMLCIAKTAGGVVDDEKAKKV
jgi:Mrp family chromosome partitioning ATPase